ncbi:hypothetical protein [Bdellovibrio bacteriovorus]|nr:hypothetical protein [Bdellovibrio bacteriovorus]
MTVAQLIDMLKGNKEFIDSTPYGYIEIVGDKLGPVVRCEDSRSLDRYINSRLNDLDVVVIREADIKSKTLSVETNGFGLVLDYTLTAFSVVEFSMHEKEAKTTDASLDTAKSFNAEMIHLFIDQSKDKKRLVS